MKEKLKEMRISVTLQAVLCIIVGLLCLIFPTDAIVTIGRIIAIAVVVLGIIVAAMQLYTFGMNLLGMAVGVILALVGIWMFARPAAIMEIIPIAVGVCLVIHGVQDMGMAVESARGNASNKWISFVLAILNIILGFVCIGCAFGLVNLAFRFIGVMLIWDGITDFGIVHVVRDATAEVVDSTIIDEEDID